MGDQDEFTGEQITVTVQSMKTWAETLKTVLLNSPDVPNDWVEPAEQMLQQMTSLEEKFSAVPQKKFKIDLQDEFELRIRIFGRSCFRDETL
jgi:hypothetical protein